MNKITPVLGISFVFVISLIYSKAGLSISMGLLVLYGFWCQRNDIFGGLKSFVKDPRFVGLTLVFLTYFLSGLNSSDSDQWLKQVRIKLPFLLLPLAFSLVGALTKKESKWLHYGLGITCLLSSIPVLWYYLQHTSDMIIAIGKGQYIPTPIDHIHYSIIMAYSALSLVVICLDRQFSVGSKERIVVGVLSIILAILIHVFAVRSGIAILYLGLTFILSWQVVVHRSIAAGVVGVIAIVSIPFLAYKTVPSLQKKIDYMVYDFNQYKKGEGKNYSDSERIMSYVIAYELAKDSPIVGHGVGDLKQLMKEKHQARYGQKEKYIFPHNQFLYVLAGVGSFGFLLFFYGLLTPLLYSRKQPLLILIFLAMFASFMVENTVQRAVSIAFFLLFILWNTKVADNEKNLSS